MWSPPQGFFDIPPLKKMWEGVAKRAQQSETGSMWTLDEGPGRLHGNHRMSDEDCWFEGLEGKRVRVTVEVLENEEDKSARG